MHRSKHTLHDPIRIERLARLSFPRYGINDVAEIRLTRSPTQIVIQLLEIFRSGLIRPNLEELDPNLPRRGRASGIIQPPRSVDNDTLRVIRECTVRDCNDIQRSDFRVLIPRQAAEIRVQDLHEPSANWCRSTGLDAAKDIADFFRGPDIRVRSGCMRGDSIAVVEEVDIDSILVMRRADRSDGSNGLLGFLPPWPGHARTVVHEEDSIELG